MIYFTSDQHYSHANVIKYCLRPFADIQEMNEAMVRLHNEVVQPDDVVYHLGDFSLWKGAPTAYLHRLNGEHHLILGNHDWPHPCRSKKEAELQKSRKTYYEAGFKTINLSGEIVIDGQKVGMHHMPYLNNDTEQYDARYKEFRPTDSGLWLLHGHVHEKWKVKGKMINVGVDVWNFKPVSIDAIAEIMRNGF